MDLSAPSAAADPGLDERPTGAPELVGLPPAEAPLELRAAPAPRRGGPITLLRFMARNRMLGPRYVRLFLGLLRRRYLSPSGRRLGLDGIAFVQPSATIEIGRRGRAELGRWSWVGDRSKLRCHEGLVSIGAKTVLGQECTVSAYQHVSIGRECVIADRAMLIDFDHTADDVERPIRLQGITKRDVRVGHNVWIGYGACLLCGVSVGDNAIIGAGAVVTCDVPANAVVAGVPARVIRMRGEPRRLRWE